MIDMDTETMKVSFADATIALANADIDGYIDDFYNSVDSLGGSPTAMRIVVAATLVIQNAGGDEKSFVLRFSWCEDTAVINTKMKAILQGFTDGVTVMEEASSYTDVQSIFGVVSMEIDY